MTTTPRAEAPKVHEQSFFLAASTEYEACIGDLYQQRIRAGDAKAMLNLAREQLRDMEAQVLVDGGREQYVIDGNEARRGAILRTALANWPAYIAKRTEIVKQERELASIEAARDRTANTMSLCKSRTDAYVAAAQQRASVLIYGSNDRAQGH